MTNPIRDVESAVRVLGALPMPVGPAALSEEQFDEVKFLDFDGLMDPNAAAIAGRMRDRLIAEIERLQAELGEEKRRHALDVGDLRWGIGQVEDRCKRLEAELAAVSGTEAVR